MILKCLQHFLLLPFVSSIENINDEKNDIPSYVVSYLWSYDRNTDVDYGK